MDDRSILALYAARDERALEEARQAYGDFCQTVAFGVLHSHEDAEECVNDVLQASWQQIPPDSPTSLRAYLGRIARNVAYTRYRQAHRQKRDVGHTLPLEELEGAIPAAASVEDAVDAALLTGYLNEWLAALNADDRTLFVRRYWVGDTVEALAAQRGDSPSHLAQVLFRLRRRLKRFLSEKGVSL